MAQFCKICNIEFKPRSFRQFMCGSLECRKIHKRTLPFPKWIPKQAPIITCRECGKSVQTKSARSIQQRYCEDCSKSRHKSSKRINCRNKNALKKEERKNKILPQKNCLTCSLVFSYRLPHQKYCSKACLGIGRKSENLLNLYGISLEEYNEMFKNQDYKCAICGDTKEQAGMRFHVDHSHKSNQVRGILCSLCNTGIGHLKESPEIFKKALTYLEKFDSKDKK